MKRINSICVGLFLLCPTARGQSDFCLTARDGFQAGITRYIYEDSQLNIWVCSSTGLYRWDGAMLRYASSVSYGETGPLLTRGVNRIYQDSQGNYWLGTADDGILKYVVRADSLLHIPVLVTQHGNMTRCWDIIEDHDGLWISGNGGLLNISLDGGGQTFYAYVLESHGTSGPIIRAIMQDPDHDDLLWVAGTFGLAEFSK
ncbi:MAG: two-component regulator propeller domain-containing protein, partial [Saprospiraceae bacterium]|nr:two-component regulator propeller domain-containing protein [Saprospiraceae bacterium]